MKINSRCPHETVGSSAPGGERLGDGKGVSRSVTPSRVIVTAVISWLSQRSCLKKSVVCNRREHLGGEGSWVFGLGRALRSSGGGFASLL